MNELSLFSGAGGGLLGTKMLGFRPIGYVEANDYCQRVISARIKDGYLEDAPIFGDIRTFLSEGYADSYKGMVDVVTGGFPCQPFSIAGKGLAEDDPRNMWPQTLEVISRVRPRYAFLENVPGLLNHEYIQQIFGDLAEIGFNARWDVISAAACGAPHRRDRFWIVAESQHTDSNGVRSHRAGEHQHGSIKPADEQISESRSMGEVLADTNKNRRDKGRESIAATGCDGLERNTWWDIEPDVGRVANGISNRVDRIKSLGNAQVPIVAATAWRLLTNQREKQ